MKRMKNGFTLVETMVALVVAALIITPLMRLLLKTIDVVSKQESRLLDQISIERFLYESRLHAGDAENFEHQEVINTQKTLHFTRSSLPKESIFAQPFLCKERVFIQDKTAKREFTQELVTFCAVFPPEKEKKEKKAESATKINLTGGKSHAAT